MKIYKISYLIFHVVVIISLAPFNTKGQSYYWIGFADKKNTQWSLSNPQQYLSERAIERRIRQNIPIDSLDIPVNSEYITQVVQHGVQHIHTSKWMNGITVRSSSSKLPEGIRHLPFVQEVILTKRNSGYQYARNKFVKMQQKGGQMNLNENSIHQVSQLNVDHLHSLGYKGEGIHIAILDAGFFGVDSYSAFDSLWTEKRIMGTRDFVNGGHDVFNGHHHGMNVLSCIAGRLEGQLTGTAPKASYWLLRTEDVGSEYLIEEDHWIVAAEFADSAGADIINSSLGYSTFDDPAMDHTYSDMDGRTTRITRGANIAFSRGMVVVASAGNEGRAGNRWKYIVAPADGDNVIATGAVNKDGLPAPFTSLGPASDGEIKPNVVAMGWNTILQMYDGTIGTGNGTSFSAPLIAGAVACLWQAYPDATAVEIKKTLEESAHLYHNPDSLVGYGIPDLKFAMHLLDTSRIEVAERMSVWNVYPVPAADFIVLQKRTATRQEKVQLGFYAPDGKLLRLEEKPDASKIIIENLHNLPAGILILQIRSGNEFEVVKILR